MNKDDENKAVQQPAAAEESGQQPVAEQDSGLPKTQEELDALIEKRLARERKKLAKASLGTQASGAPAAEGSAAQPEAQSAQPGVDAAALAEKDRELLIARAQLDAYREGIVPGAVEDAVCLAVMQAEKAGEADEEGVRDALKEVLKRHPEWKPQKKETAKNGFKVGVDTTGADGKDGAGKRALPTGTVIL